MTATTTITLTTGERFDVRGGYDDVSAMLSPRRLSADDGFRELTQADGRRARIQIGTLAAIVEQQKRARRQAVGFR